MKITTIITAGGTSSRFGNTNKLLEKIHSKEIIKHTIEAFLGVDEIDEIIICANPSIFPDLKMVFKSQTKVKIREGGKSRQ